MLAWLAAAPQAPRDARTQQHGASPGTVVRLEEAVGPFADAVGKNAMNGPSPHWLAAGVPVTASGTHGNFIGMRYLPRKPSLLAGPELPGSYADVLLRERIYYPWREHAGLYNFYIGSVFRGPDASVLLQWREIGVWPPGFIACGTPLGNQRLTT